MIERRRAERVPMAPRESPVSVVGARILDMSPFGMKIESRVAISPDAVLAFRIVVDGRTSDVGCRVVNCRPIGGGDQRLFAIGLEFLDLPDSVADRLREVLPPPTA